jgi:hypothetical protein
MRASEWILVIAVVVQTVYLCGYLQPEKGILFKSLWAVLSLALCGAVCQCNQILEELKRWAGFEKGVWNARYLLIESRGLALRF